MAGGSSEIEAKWQERWYSARINESNPDSRPKFMIIFAYPGVTGYLHVGHMRGYTYADAIARYKMLEGYNVLFPVGTHATGNGAISLAKRVRNLDRSTIEYLLYNGCPEGRIDELKDPAGVVKFFNDIYVNEYWKRFGFMSDWRRFTSTIFPEYNRFIQWQFRKLMEKGLLIQKPYFAPACVTCGPVAIDASETDLQRGGNAETQEYTLLKFRFGDFFLMAATLRPETVFGQTNFWIDPEVEYAKVRKDGEIWIVSQPAFEKLRYQKDDLEMIGTIFGRELIGVKCIAPVIHREIPVLPASFCDPNVGTGLVTSVPSDAPDDWIALKNLQDDLDLMLQYGLDPEEVRAIMPIAIIDTKGWGPLPAVEIVDKLEIKQSGDPRLVDAKKEIYKAGFHTGRMNSNCRQFAGLPVDKAKEQIKQMMLESGEADVLYDLSEEVICRCGGKVVIRKVPDQWFIDYGNKELTEKSKAQAQRMKILPSDYYANISGVLDWFRERACVRQGNWLGTRFPFDEKWIIEAISDSTLYPLFYLVANYVNDGRVRPEQLGEEVFDFIFLGKGEVISVSKSSGIPSEVLEQMKADVHYWYPLDINLGGKDHMTVHFPVFLMNHVAILPENLWPKGIFVNWYIVGKGGKISKSKGGAQPIPGAAQRFGVDSLRLYYVHIASPFADVDWDEDDVDNYSTRMEKIQKTIRELRATLFQPGITDVDRWLLSRINSRIDAIKTIMEGFDMRAMANEVYFEMLSDARWYQRRGGRNQEVIERLLDAWIRLMAPITPHIAEELWEQLGRTPFVSTSSFPAKRDSEVDPRAEEGEEFLKSTLADINEILKVTGIRPKHVYLYTSAKWKHLVYKMGLQLAHQKQLTIPGLTKMAMADAQVKQKGKEAADYARKVAEDLVKRSEAEGRRLSVEFDELRYLEDAAVFITEEIGCDVDVFEADDPDMIDPRRKARSAQPRRPAIFVE